MAADFFGVPRRCFRLGTLFLACAGMAGPAAEAQAEAWITIGPQGGPVAGIAPDASDPSVLYAATRTGNVFRTGDFAQSWSIRESGRLGTSISEILCDCTRRGWLYANLGREILRSTDGAVTWQPTGFTPALGLSAERLVVDSRRDLLLVGTERGLLRSRDFGATWTDVSPGPPGGLPWIRELMVHPAGDGAIFAATLSDLFRSSDGGDSWTLLTRPPETPVRRLLGHPREAGVLYLGTNRGRLFRSIDGGSSWIPLDRTLPGFNNLQLVTQPSAPRTDVLITNAEGLWRSTGDNGRWSLLVREPFVSSREERLFQWTDSGPTLFAATDAGIYRSDDGGSTWVEADAGLSAYHVTGLAADRRRPGALVAGGLRSDFFRTRGGGELWTRTVAPLDSFGVNLPLIAHPADPLVFYRGDTNGGIFRSRDGGETWSLTPAFFQCSFTGGLGVSASSPAIVYASGFTLTSGCPLEFPEACFTYKSTDGGESWSCAGSGTEFSPAVLVDPRNPDRVYIGNSSSGDGGLHWQAGLGLDRSVNALAFDPGNPNQLYAGSTEGFFKSEDRGISWQPAMNGLPPGPVTGVLNDPFDSSAVLAVVRGELFRSTDRAQSWQGIGPPEASPPLSGPLVIHPLEPNVIYAGTEDRGVVRRSLLRTGECSANERSHCLLGGRFRVEVLWRDFRGRIGSGHRVDLTPDTGAFWFFERDNLELVVKVLNGQGFNGKYWVFYGALTNVEFTLTVTDTATGEVRTYFNPARNFGSRGDTTAFPGDGGVAAERAATGPAWRTGEPARTHASPSGGCQPSPTVLCLGEGFQLRVRWKDFRGREGVGKAVPLTGDTGYFWFFDRNNVELMVKVLDGRDFNGHFWVFYGALSNVEYTLEVENTATGAVRTYFNPSGRFASQGDTRAF